MIYVQFALNPRMAILCALAYSLVIAMLSRPMFALAAALPPLFLLLLATQDWSALAKRLRAPFTFIIFLCLFVPFTTPGPSHPFFGIVGISSPGIDLALLITLKCLGLLATFSALIAPMSSSILASALHGLHCPWQLITMFLLMDMNLHIIKKEWTRLKMAALLRGFNPSTNMHTYRAYAAMLALWLVRAAERAKRIHEGMLLKGFNGRFPVLPSKHFGKPDYFFASVTLILSGLFVMLDLTAGKP